MKAARFIAPGRIEITDVPSPDCRTGEVVVEVHRAGICGTDLRIYRGKKEVKPPVTLGHEFSGTIADLDTKTSDLTMGMQVTVEPIIPCGTCYCCRAGRENICLTRPTIGYQFDGGFAEYVRIPGKAIEMGNVIPFGEELGFDAACYAEPLAACINGMRKLSLGNNDRIWIIGDGPIGLTHTQLASSGGAQAICLTGTRDERLTAGARLSATEALHVMGGAYPSELILENAEGDGVGVSIAPANGLAALAEAVNGLRKGGRILLFAGYPTVTAGAIDLSDIH